MRLTLFCEFNPNLFGGKILGLNARAFNPDFKKNVGLTFFVRLTLISRENVHLNLVLRISVNFYFEKSVIR